MMHGTTPQQRDNDRAFTAYQARLARAAMLRHVARWDFTSRALVQLLQLAVPLADLVLQGAGLLLKLANALLGFRERFVAQADLLAQQLEVQLKQRYLLLQNRAALDVAKSGDKATQGGEEVCHAPHGATGTTPQQRDNDRAFTAYQARLARRAESAANFILALLLAIGGALLLAHWLTPCDAGQLCALSALATRRVRADSVPADAPSALPLVADAVRRAYTQGEREGYTAGWRWGLLCGACWCLPLGLGLGLGALWLGLGWPL